MFPIIHIGPLAVSTPGLILLAGVWLGISAAEKHANNYKIDPNNLYNTVLFSLVFGLLGARLAFFARYPLAFVGNWISIISLNPSLLEPTGSLLGVLVGLLYAKKRKLGLWDLLDALTPTFAVVSISIGLAHLASGIAYGLPARLPWSIEMWGEYRHPTQVYWLVISSLIFWITWPGRVGFQPSGSGIRFLIFSTLTASGLLLSGAFLVDNAPLPGGFHRSQIIAWIILAVSLWGLEKRFPSGRENSQQPSHIPQE